MKLRKRKDGLWTTQVRVSKGKYKSVYAKTKKECTEKAYRLVAELENGVFIEPDKTTVAQWAEKWEENYLLNIVDSTKILYTETVERFVLPTLGDVRLQSVTTDMLQGIFADMLDNGLTPGYMGQVKLVMSRFMRDAVKAGLISENPVKDVTLPRYESREMNVLEPGELRALIDSTDGVFKSVFEFAALTGLRKGELNGLRFSKIDFDKSTLLVDTQYNYMVDKFTLPKRNKKRLLVLPDRAIEIVKERKAYVDKRRELDPGYDPEDLVFCAENGSLMPFGAYYRTLHKFGETIGKPELTIHDLRHTYATLALRAGVDIKTVQENLGHHSSAFTLDRYAHSTADMKREGADKLNSLLYEG